VWQGDFRSLDLPLETYDLVVLNHVFEHLDEPLGALQRIRQLLKPNGRAVLVYPNPDSMGAKIFGSSWFPWEAPRHLALLTSDGLAEIAKRAGLSVNQIRTSGSSAASWFAQSRAYRAGRSLNEFPCRVSYLDRIAARSEGVLTHMGFNVGEELTVVLVRTPQPKEGF
jgi:SAM-dependent methyltransferase